MPKSEQAKPREKKSPVRTFPRSKSGTISERASQRENQQRKSQLLKSELVKSREEITSENVPKKGREVDATYVDLGQLLHPSLVRKEPPKLHIEGEVAPVVRFEAELRIQRAPAPRHGHPSVGRDRHRPAHPAPECGARVSNGGLAGSRRCRVKRKREQI